MTIIERSFWKITEWLKEKNQEDQPDHLLLMVSLLLSMNHTKGIYLWGSGIIRMCWIY